MKSFILFLFLTGLLTIIVSYMRKMKTKVKTKIEYRYIPRNYINDQFNPPKLEKVYDDMFENRTPWMTYPLNSSDPVKPVPARNL